MLLSASGRWKIPLRSSFQWLELGKQHVPSQVSRAKLYNTREVNHRYYCYPADQLLRHQLLEGSDNFHGWGLLADHFTSGRNPMPFWEGLVSRKLFSFFPIVLLSQPPYSNRSGLLHEAREGDAGRVHHCSLAFCLPSPRSSSLTTCSQDGLG